MHIPHINKISNYLSSVNIIEHKRTMYVTFYKPIIIIVLINGCFHNGPAMCPRSVTMAQGVCIGPRQRRGTIH